MQISQIGGGGDGGGGGREAVPTRPDAQTGSELLKPTEGFVIKTWKRQAGRANFDRTLGKV